MLKAVLWDFDGTIVNSLKHHLFSWKEAFKESGTDLTDDEVIKNVFYQFHDEENPKYKLTKSTIEEYHKNIEQTVEKFELHEHIDQVLEILINKDVKMAIVSFVEKERIIPVLEKFKLDKHFEIVLGYGDVEKVKPDPEIANKALAHLNVSPNEALLVGDTGLDIQTGVNAGVMTAFYNPETNRLFTDMSLFRGVKPNFEFQHFDEFLPKIERFLK